MGGDMSEDLNNWKEDERNENEIQNNESNDQFWVGILCAIVFNLAGVVIGFTYQGEMRETFFYGFRKGLVMSVALIILVLVIWLFWSQSVGGKQ